MKKEINMDDWYRKDHFEFFSKFSEPFFGITAKIDCTKAYQIAKENKISFFLYYLHKSLVAANNVQPFKYRIQENKVFEYDVVNASPTINRENGSFGFSYFDYYEDFNQFSHEAKPKIEDVRKSSGLVPAVSGENVIHYSSIPWIDFSAISHARHFSFSDSCPKISFGKMISDGNKKVMSVSVHAHHALMDGYHVGQFMDKFQNIMEEKN